MAAPPAAKHSDLEGDVLVVEESDACLAIWLDADAQAIRALDAHAGRSRVPFALKTFVRAATDPLPDARPELPARVRVRHRDTAVALRRAVGGLGIVVEQRESLPALLETQLTLIERLADLQGDETTAASAKRMLAALEELTLAPEGMRLRRATDEGLFERVTVGSLDVEQDLLPKGARVGLGGIPEGELDELRRRAEVHEGAPIAVERRGAGLPATTVLATPAAGRRIVDQLRSEGFEGLATVDYPGRGALVLALTRVPRAHELVRARASDVELIRAVALFARRTREFGGAHALLVLDGSREGDCAPPVLGLFEAVLVRHD